MPTYYLRQIAVLSDHLVPAEYISRTYQKSPETLGSTLTHRKALSQYEVSSHRRSPGPWDNGSFPNPRDPFSILPGVPFYVSLGTLGSFTLADMETSKQKNPNKIYSFHLRTPMPMMGDRCKFGYVHCWGKAPTI